MRADGRKERPSEEIGQEQTDGGMKDVARGIVKTKSSRRRSCFS